MKDRDRGLRRVRKNASKRTKPSALRTLSDVMVGRRIELVPISRLRAGRANPRLHSRWQLNLIAQSIKRFGFVYPILIDSNNLVIVGHARIKAAQQIGLSSVPALRIEHLDATAKRVYALADNRLAELAGWDRKRLMIELQALIDI